jgi:hypothetical protein
MGWEEQRTRMHSETPVKTAAEKRTIRFIILPRALLVLFPPVAVYFPLQRAGTTGN